MSSIEKAMERQPTKSKEVTGSTASHDSSLGEEIQQQGSARDKVYSVNILKLEQDGLLVPAQGGYCLAEEYRMIKRPLLQNAFGKGAAPVPHGNLVMVVSALASEGKTFTTLNLAMSIAMERDTTVLVVDSDIVKPSLSQALGVQDKLGLTDLLHDETLNVGSAIINTDISRLKVLPAGRTNIYSTELLASKRMELLSSELSERYPDRVVLFDSPPLLVTSQACVLSQQMGQILAVVEAGRTAQSAVNEALALLDSRKVIGLVLNKKPGSFFGGDYTPYGQGYEHGSLEKK